MKMVHRRDPLKIIASMTKNDMIRNQVNRSYYYNNCKRRTWQVINEVTSHKSNKSVLNELEYSERQINNPVEIAETFGKFFLDIGPELSKDSYEEFIGETGK